jgi:hypothetical protein
MDFNKLFDLIDTQLQTNDHLAGSQHSEDAEGRMWTRNGASAKIAPSGTTGIAVSLMAGDRVVHQRIFAASDLSVARIARWVAEHLSGYVRSA